VTTVHTNVPVLVQRAGYVRAAKQCIHDHGCYHYVSDGRLYLEGEEDDYDITNWNLQSLRVLFSGVLKP